MALIDNIVAYYKLDDNLATTNVIDATGTSDGTLGGGDNTEDLSVVGKINTALDFNGIDDYVNCNFVPTTDAAWTWTGWIKTTATLGWILSSAGQAGDNTEGVNLYGPATNKLGVFSGGGVEARHLGQSTTTINDGAWHFFAVVYNGTNGLIYVDGGAAEVDTAWTPYFSVENLYFAERGVLFASWLDGTLDEVGIWSRALGAAEILELWNDGNGLAYPFVPVTNMKINISDVWKDIDSLKINIGDAWKNVIKIQQNIGNVWKTVFG